MVGLTTQSFRVRNISCTNVTDGYEALINSTVINVTIRGTEEKLAQIQPEQIRAVADLTDYNESTGQFMPEVKIFVDGVTEVGAVGDNTISIEIRKA